ncbi:flagellar hook-basal body complex protein FliE [Chelativorans sp. Marseille-P2723]|uniref:flagellar hook-basal body complex protein FliE n=1 Tax=Chelativorans sp. Marseille-P2723 TaxID=2709133 RepID=UPI00156DA2B3|nr:flagellar hook-basal body complex protein FliE [Chelativorans sp. Marseille-P2723]
MISGIANLPRISAIGTDPVLSEPKLAPTDGDAFSAMVSELAADTVSRLTKAENLSLQALQGEAETRAVVDAVMDAEQSLQAAIAIRDKIVTAYLEISRMAI